MDDNASDNTTATLAIPRALANWRAHWLPVSLTGLKAQKLDSLSDAELGPFAPGALLDKQAGAEEEGAAAAAGPAPDDAPSSDQQPRSATAGSAPASAALKASLRGRALAGARWPLPPGVGGLVLEPAPDLDVEEDVMEEDDDHYDDDDDYCMGRQQRQKGQQRPGSAAGGQGGGSGKATAPRQRSWRAVAAFNELVAWNHDTAPAPTDAAWRLMDFLAVSAAAHGGGAAPITAADVDAEVARVGGGGSGGA